MTTTALADGLVRDFGLPFRTAHHITALASEGGVAEWWNDRLDHRRRGQRHRQT
ncbi:MAG: hypothetical protein R2839_11780 [Thermomicrobiales bacterium]